ncbi:hypothetical protein OHB36_24890 [Streptomyces sp. NBC_00320]|uniref:hypothetical protein n=1 Tax=unclassified Streptomyces TaxID=2593676 RepID=UPI00225625C8|nr:hypothetical protein [Streptomyces sp. NBC_00320]MCX5149971.1 hypothetical protein [Streptomyces sp. NBC_00320]
MQSNTWSDWLSLGGSLAGTPAVGRNCDGYLEVLARGTDGTLKNIRQDPDSDTGTGWANWTSLGGEPTPATPAVAGHPAGVRGLDVFARGANGTVHHCWQTNPLDPYEWSDWHALD